MARNTKLKFPGTLKLFKIHFDTVLMFEIDVQLTKMLNIQLQQIT